MIEYIVEKQSMYKRKSISVSAFFHHFQMKSIHRRYDLKGNFEDFANLFLQEATEYGSYWNMLKVKIIRLVF